jgi:hypothetical protein
MTKETFGINDELQEIIKHLTRAVHGSHGHDPQHKVKIVDLQSKLEVPIHVESIDPSC